MDYRKEIDGLRALAVLPIILFHTGFEKFSGGFIGVDVFFVISGYLITTIILAELEQGKFSIINFYERRLRRILPALYFVLFICIPFAYFWLLPSDMRDFSKSLVAVSFFVSNILFWQDSSYFASALELKPLLHTWSLAVEEQFYIFFPAFLMLFWKLGKYWVLVMLGFLFVASFALAEWASYVKPSPAFYLLPTRGWELLIGVFAAFYLSQNKPTKSKKIIGELMGWLGVTLIFYAIFNYGKNTPFPGFYALVPTLGALLIILFATQRNSVGKFLGNKIFCGIGLISYSSYLWHQPLFAFAKYRGFSESNYYIFSFLFATTFVLAYLSWKFIETPFRKKDNFFRETIFKLSFLFSIFFVIIGSYGIFKNGFNSRFPAYSEVLSKLQWTEENNITSNCKNLYGGDQYCLITNSLVAPTDLLIGDSHANHFFLGLSHYLEKNNRNLLMFGAGGCPPLIDVDMGFHYTLGVKLRCHERTSDSFKKFLKNSSINNIFLSFSANGYLDLKIDLYDLDGEINFSVDRSNALVKAFLRTVKFAQANGKNVFVIEDLPDVTFDNFKRCLVRTNNLDNSIDCLKVKNINIEYFKILDELQSNGVKIIKTSHLLNQFPYTKNGDFMYRDGTHLSKYGSLYFGENLSFDE